jgi:hypothetical protein
MPTPGDIAEAAAAMAVMEAEALRAQDALLAAHAELEELLARPPAPGTSEAEYVATLKAASAKAARTAREATAAVASQPTGQQ